MLEKITKALSISLPAHVLRSKDPRAVLNSIFSSWLPLSTALLVSVIEYLPSPFASQRDRMPQLIKESPGGTSVANDIREALINPSQARRPAVAYVSKMVAIPGKELSAYQQPNGPLTPEQSRERVMHKRAEIAKLRAVDGDKNRDDEDEGRLRDALSKSTISTEMSEDLIKGDDRDVEHLIGFARLFSGTLSVGDEIYVIPPKFDPSRSPVPAPAKVIIKGLYLLMGRSLEPLKEVAAGSIFGIEGLQGHIFKSGTLCSQAEGAINLAGVVMGSRPILRVALEPANPSELDRMIEGLKILEQSDPCAEYEVLDSGEHAILTAGELHLERCLKDLRERFAGIDIDAGEAIVPYRETIVFGEEMPATTAANGIRGSISEDDEALSLVLQIRVVPMPSSLAELLEQSAGAIRKLTAGARITEPITEAPKSEMGDHPAANEDADRTGRDVVDSSIQSVEQFKQSLIEVLGGLEQDQQLWSTALSTILSFGPRRTGPNLLLDQSKNPIFRPLFDDQSPSASSGEERSTQLADRIIQAFQLSTLRGPLCAEPTQGVAVFIEKLERRSSELAAGSRRDDGVPMQQVGEILKMVQHSIHRGFLDWSPRIMLAMYSCEIASSTEVLGRVYSVITRRRGRILSEAMREGTPFFTIEALIPVVESFGFSEEIRKRTSGAAAPQLVFWGFDAINEDPFWVPRSEEELEDLGEKGDRENVAKRYVDKVRTRKGMLVKGRMVVEHAEKQKTLKR